MIYLWTLVQVFCPLEHPEAGPENLEYAWPTW